MAPTSRSAQSWVQTLQSLVAVELVEGLGVPGRRAADLLGVAPSAVSQYLSGRRAARVLPPGLTQEEANTLAYGVARQIVEAGTGGAGPRILLESAAASWARGHPAGSRATTARRGATPPAADRERTKQLRARIQSEQAAVADCMHLAQKARDELTRAIFRQIASDSLRHAEIVASLAAYSDRGMHGTLASGITREDVERLVERERKAEEKGHEYLTASLTGVMALLAASIEADERKHDELLAGLLEQGFQPSPSNGKGGPRRAP